MPSPGNHAILYFVIKVVDQRIRFRVKTLYTGIAKREAFFAVA